MVSSMNVVVTGGAGFIGSHLVDYLMSAGNHVVVIDDLSSGSLDYIKQWDGLSGFRFIKSDLRVFNPEWLDSLRDCDVVFHFAANPEVRISIQEPRIHFEENVLVTFNVLEAVRLYRVKYLVFASSSTVYGDPINIPTSEWHPIQPISVYGASKAASEILINSYAKLYGLKALILRYANIVGPRLRHGVIWDFINKLRYNQKVLEILGDGSQRKSYLHVIDAINATFKAFEYFKRYEDSVLVYNVGNSDFITVKEIADIVVQKMGLRNVEYIFKPGTFNGRGWLGDVKVMLLDITKIMKEINWKPRYSSREAIELTIESILKNV
ncbi:MAG: NAD-dependent epimerase/dehydratase family protein [Thermoprotei archaeon]